MNKTHISWLSALVVLGISCGESAPPIGEGEGDVGEGEGEGEPLVYATESRSLDVAGTTRTFITAVPVGTTNGLPVVLSLHGDGGSGAGMRATLSLEASLRAIHVYPDAPSGTFEYYTSTGRENEVAFVRAVVADLVAVLDVDPTRVFLVGFSGGATMANAVGCRMGGAIRGMGVHSGTLYPVDGDFTYTANGGVDCALPATMFVWGQTDMTDGVSYLDGENVRSNYLATQACAATTTPVAESPCELYDGCARDIAWCGIPSLAHAVWPNAGRAMAAFFATR
jgi:polyhydroxybutyrate depolymerase